MDLAKIVELRLQVEPPPDVPIARSFLTNIYDGILETCSFRKGLEHQSELIASVILTQPQQMRFGYPEPIVILLIHPEYPHARDWAAQTLKELSPQLGTSCSMEMHATDKELVPLIQQIGFGISKLDLIGDVSVAIKHLEGKTIDPTVLGIRFEPLTAALIPEVNQMISDFFVAHPEFGWGGQVVSKEQQQKINRREENRILQQITEYPESNFAIYKDDRIVGNFGFMPNPGNPFFGNCGGMNIILLPEIQGMGVGKAAYLKVTKTMKSMNLDWLIGRTSNPGVLKIGHQVGRRVRRYLFRKEGPFIDPKHIF